MSKNYSIVAATRRHVSAVPKLEQAAAALFPEADLPAALRYLVTDHDILADAQKNGRLWMALDDEQRPVGFALAVVLDGEAFLDEVDVHPRHLRRGIGTRLVNTVIGWAEAREFQSLSLITFRHLPWNAPFYEAFGFKPLAPHELGKAMAQILAEEADAGIDIANRIGMRRVLHR